MELSRLSFKHYGKVGSEFASLCALNLRHTQITLYPRVWGYDLLDFGHTQIEAYAPMINTGRGGI